MLHLFAIFTEIGQERAINFLESLWLLLPTLSPGRQIGLDPVSEITALVVADRFKIGQPMTKPFVLLMGRVGSAIAHRSDVLNVPAFALNAIKLKAHV